jgi:hypothetical protein
MDNINQRKQEVPADQGDLLKRVAQAAATRLTPIETHSICVLLSMAFGRGTLQSRTFAWHVNEARRSLGLPQITQAAASNPTMQEQVDILRSAVEKLGDKAQSVLIRLLLLSPFYETASDSNVTGDEKS